MCFGSEHSYVTLLVLRATAEPMVVLVYKKRSSQVTLGLSDSYAVPERTTGRRPFISRFPPSPSHRRKDNIGTGDRSTAGVVYFFLLLLLPLLLNQADERREAKERYEKSQIEEVRAKAAGPTCVRCVAAARKKQRAKRENRRLERPSQMLVVATAAADKATAITAVPRESSLEW